MKKLMAFLLGAVLCCSCAPPVYARTRKPKLQNPEARAALKRNKAVQRKMKKMAKSRNKETKYLKAAR